MADPETMSYNHAWGGTIPFPQEEWRDWYDFWIVNHESKRYYRYLMDNTGRFIGEIAYHYDSGRYLYVADVIVHAHTEVKVMATLDWTCCVVRLKRMA